MDTYTPFTIIGRTTPFCTYCEQAKQLLSSKGIPFTFLDLGKDISREQLFELVPDAKTVPQIFEGNPWDGLYIGGFNHLQGYLDNQS